MLGPIRPKCVGVWISTGLSVSTNNIEKQLVTQGLYLLIIPPTCFGLSSWPSSVRSYAFEHVQHVCLQSWQE